MNQGTAISARLGDGARHETRRRQRSLLRLVAWVCIGLGLVLLVTTILGAAYAATHQYQLNQSWTQTLRQSPPPANPVEPPPPSMLHPVNGVDFAIRVPAIDYYSAVQEGVSSDILEIGPGHYPDTKWPGQVGTVGVAAHNTYWLKFANVKPGDIVILETRYGTFRYRVTGTRLVWPSDRTVLIPNTPDRRLTLTTCWPLWAGAFATQRLVIFTTEVSASEPGAAPKKPALR